MTHKNKIYKTASHFFPEEEIPGILGKIKEILEGKKYLTKGEYVEKFEKEFSNYIGTRYGISTNSGTSALETTLEAVGIENKEVIVPVQTFVSTGTSIVKAGGKPVFADINPEDLNISLKSIKEKTSKDTKAIIVVHFGGLISENIFRIRNFCEENDIFLIEDCAHAHGAKINDAKAGSIGDAGIYSFYATKVMTTGEGGMIVTDDDRLKERIFSLKEIGLSVDTDEEVYSRIGGNYRMPDISAILGLSQLKNIDEFVAHRNQIAKIYDEILTPLENDLLSIIHTPNNIVNSYWRYTLKLDGKYHRKRLKDEIDNYGIKIDWPYKPPLHLQPVFKKLYDIEKGSLPNAEKVMKRHVCLPIHLEIQEKDAKYIGKKFKKALKKEVNK